MTGKGVVIHAPEGSYASSRAEADLREAERALATLKDILRPAAGASEGLIDVYETDGFADLAADGSVPGDAGSHRPGLGLTGERAVVRVVQPDALGEPVTWSVTRIALARWFSPEAASSDLFATGIAGVVAARIGSGPTLRDVKDRIRDDLANGRPVSIFASDAAESGAATAFVAYLLDAYGR